MATGRGECGAAAQRARAARSTTGLPDRPRNTSSSPIPAIKPPPIMAAHVLPAKRGRQLMVPAQVSLPEQQPEGTVNKPVAADHDGPEDDARQDQPR